MRQCSLPRNTPYYRPLGPSPEYRRMREAAVAVHREQPSMGARRLALQLERRGFKCGRKMARCLMIDAKLRSASPGPHRSPRPRLGATPAHNCVGACDLTPLQVGSGLMHATVIIDLHSRLCVGFRLSNTADAELCLNALADACRDYGCLAIFHSDKGSQFTSRSFRSELRRRGWKDNVFVERFIWCLKHECSRLREWNSGSQARSDLADFIRFYNFERRLCKLQGRPPAQAYGLSDNISDAPLVPSGC